MTIVCITTSAWFRKKCNWKRAYGHIKLESNIWSWSCSSCMRSVYVIQNTLANCVRVISGERRQFMCLFMCLSLPLHLYTGTCCTIKRCSNWKVPIRNCRRVVGPARSHRCIFFYVHRLLSHEKIVHSEMYTDFCFYIQTDLRQLLFHRKLELEQTVMFSNGTTRELHY